MSENSKAHHHIAHDLTGNYDDTHSMGNKYLYTWSSAKSKKKNHSNFTHIEYTVLLEDM